MDRKNPQVAIGQINLSKHSPVKLQDGGPDGAMFKKSLIVFEGDFMGMFGPITIGEDFLNLMADRFNREFKNPKNEHDYPPLLVDHDSRADNVMGRILPPLVVEEWTNPRNGENIKAMFGDIRVDDTQAKEKVINGKYSHLSVSFDDDKDNLGEIFELSFVGVEAARGAQVLNKGDTGMDEIAKLTNKLQLNESKMKVLKANSGQKRTVRLASYKSLSQNVELVSKESKEVSEKIKVALESLKKTVIKSQLASYVLEGRLSKAEFDKIELDSVCKMTSESQKIYLSSFANRPVSSDLLQHGMTGADPLDGKGLKLSGAELRKAMKAQKAGEDFTPSKKNLGGHEDEEEKKKREEASKAQKGDEEPEVKTDLTMDDIEDALSKLEGLSTMADKIKEAGERMTDTLSKLQGDDDKEEKENDKD